MTQKPSYPPNRDAPFLGALLKRAALSPSLSALQEKRRGAWVVRQWRDVVEEVDRLAAGLAALGVQPGGAVGIDGEIGGRTVLAAAAVAALGARILSIPTRASQEERDSVMDDPSVALVIGRERDAVAEWTRHTAGARRIPIVLDHATAGGRPPSDGVLAYDALRGFAKPAGWRNRLPPSPPAYPISLSQPPPTAQPKLWIEESTDWSQGLEAILRVWVERGYTLALPELLAASDRDRREAAPQAWLVSPAALERAAARIFDRLPAEGTLSAALVTKALDNRSLTGSVILRSGVRNLLGLGALDEIEVDGASRQAISAKTFELFQRLGAPPRFDGKTETESVAARAGAASFALAAGAAE